MYVLVLLTDKLNQADIFQLYNSSKCGYISLISFSQFLDFILSYLALLKTLKHVCEDANAYANAYANALIIISYNCLVGWIKM